MLQHQKKHATAQCTMSQHQNSVASQIAVPPHTKNPSARYCSTPCNTAALAHCTMLRHIVQCNGSKNSTMPWCKKTVLAVHCQCHGTKKCHSMKHNATAQKAAHGKMPQQIVEGSGTKHNAMELITLPQNKAHFRDTKKSPPHKKVTAVQNNCHGTKNCAAAQSAMPRHIKQHFGTKLLPQNAANVCTRPRQKNHNPKHH